MQCGRIFFTGDAMNAKTKPIYTEDFITIERRIWRIGKQIPESEQEQVKCVRLLPESYFKRVNGTTVCEKFEIVEKTGEVGLPTDQGGPMCWLLETPDAEILLYLNNLVDEAHKKRPPTETEKLECGIAGRILESHTEQTKDGKDVRHIDKMHVRHASLKLKDR